MSVVRQQRLFSLAGPDQQPLLIDKPTGMTSHDVVDEVRRLTGQSKVGHAGTLDPLATGLLIVLVGRQQTKRQPEFTKLDKEYLVTASLGVETDSYDIDGTVLVTVPSQRLAAVNVTDIERCLRQFRGEIDQQVPPFSAVKRGGTKLYELARRGRLDLAALPVRRVTIYRLELVSFRQSRLDTQFSLKVKCSSGTYVRSLVHHTGQCLGVGAIVTSLRRTAIGPYRLSQACSLEELARR
ncbi:MAG: tRNA pseudouridine(55) synthase TruB [Candidatus Pacebacteria bacterium CG10_big_fil_rev_8_21_14_0_10_56_10]|nr:MAG: tRNA pseudouridine(55) synthase TruB [Candidatus Pacebacteria bacterium CG10_big_fil_rev_8_21_14_0_10_56_10]